MNTSKLLEMYKSTFKPALAEGKYTVTLKSHKYEEDETNPKIRIEMEIKDTGRVIVENRFVNNFPIMISHLRQQLKRDQEEIIPKNFLNELIKNKTEFNIWIVKRIVNGTQKTNVNFLEPIKQEETKTNFVSETKPNLTVVDDDPTKEEVEELFGKNTETNSEKVEQIQMEEIENTENTEE